MGFQSGTVSRLVNGGTTNGVLFTDTQIDVDTTNGLPTIIKLQPIDPSQGKASVYINDYGDNCSVGNITVVASAGNLINGFPTLVLNIDGLIAEIEISDQNNFIAHLNTDSGGGGTITGANNGLSVFMSLIQLGGALIKPTTVNATSVNYFDLQDSYGSFVKTRDAFANFSIADFGANSYIGFNTNIFSYLSTQNTYTNSNIVLNFGSVGNYTNAVDTWNFGDYSSFVSTFQSFNLGRNNAYANTFNASVFGNYNVLSGGNTLRIIGDSNFINGSDVFLFGHNNNFSGGGGYIIGHNVNVDDTFVGFGSGNIFSLGSNFTIVGGVNCDAIVNVGFASSINATSQTRGVYIFGDSHICTDFVTYSTLIGESCNFTRVDHATTIGIFNSLTDVNYVYNFGESNVIESSVGISNFGIGNYISASNNLSVFGNNNVISDSNKLYIGNNNNNLVVDGLTGDVGVGIFNPLAKFHNFGMSALGVNQRLEPVTGVIEDTNGSTLNTVDATADVTLQAIPIPTDTVVTIKTNIKARKTAGIGVGTVGEGCGYELIATYQNIGGVVTIAGIVQVSYTGEAIAGLDTNLLISGTNVLVAVTGVLDDDITWTNITKKY